jgi:hypothetical protein
LPEVKARIKELSSNSLLKRDKIFLHTLSKTQKVELGERQSQSAKRKTEQQIRDDKNYKK